VGWVGKIYRVSLGHPLTRFGPKPLPPPPPVVGFRFENRSTYLSYFGKNKTSSHKSSAVAVAVGRYDIIILLASNP